MCECATKAIKKMFKFEKKQRAAGDLYSYDCNVEHSLIIRIIICASSDIDYVVLKKITSEQVYVGCLQVHCAETLWSVEE
jgi:hypothetical protein